MSTAAVGRLVSEFCRWGSGGALHPRSVRLLPQILRDKVLPDLASRDSSSEVILRELEVSKQLPGISLADLIWLVPVGRKKSYGAYTIPAWRRGWRLVVKNPDLEDTISWFFHCASQYVARARASVLAFSVSVAYDVPVSIFGSRMSMFCVERRIGMEEKDLVGPVIKKRFRRSVPVRPSDGRAFRVQQWAQQVNTLDPFLQRAVFQYLRARELDEAGFCEQAINCLDNILSILDQFLQARKVHASVVKRVTARNYFPPEDRQLLEQLYLLRSEFAGHPSQWKWWDFAEIYEEKISGSFDVAIRAVRLLGQLERHHRVVDPWPKSWSHWFECNADWLWDAVWFARLPF